jgi:hypothetical protein
MLKRESPVESPMSYVSIELSEKNWIKPKKDQVVVIQNSKVSSRPYTENFYKKKKLEGPSIPNYHSFNSNNKIPSGVRDTDNSLDTFIGKLKANLSSTKKSETQKTEIKNAYQYNPSYEKITKIDCKPINSLHTSQFAFKSSSRHNSSLYKIPESSNLFKSQDPRPKPDALIHMRKLNTFNKNKTEYKLKTHRLELDSLLSLKFNPRPQNSKVNLKNTQTVDKTKSLQSDNKSPLLIKSFSRISIQSRYYI